MSTDSERTIARNPLHLKLHDQWMEDPAVCRIKPLTRCGDAAVSSLSTGALLLLLLYLYPKNVTVDLTRQQVAMLAKVVDQIKEALRS